MQPMFTTNDSEFTRLEGLYIKETNPPPQITGVFLGVTGITGECVRGPVAKAVEIFNSGLAEAKTSIAPAAQVMPMYKPIADMLDTVKGKTQEATVTMTGQFKGEPAKLLTFPGMWFLAMPR